MLILQVRRVDEDELVMLHGQVDVALEYSHLVDGVLIEPNLTNAEHRWPIQEFRNEIQNLLPQHHVLRFLGINAKPAEMGQPVFSRALWFEVGKLAKVIVKALHTAAVEPRPKSRLAYGCTPGGRHR